MWNLYANIHIQKIKLLKVIINKCQRGINDRITLTLTTQTAALQRLNLDD